MHSDGSGELEHVCKFEGITHSTIETGDHAANGIAEGHIQLAKLGAATLLAQAGLTKTIGTTLSNASRSHGIRRPCPVVVSGHRGRDGSMGRFQAYAYPLEQRLSSCRLDRPG